MKRTFKLKALVLVVAALLAVALVPRVKAASDIQEAKYKNYYTNSNDAATIFKLSAVNETDSTRGLEDLKPGDIIAVTFSMTKAPSAGLLNISIPIGWNSDNLALYTVGEARASGETIKKSIKDYQVYLTSGEVGEEISLGSFVFGAADDKNVHTLSPFENVEYIKVGAAAQSREPTRNLGDIFTLKFKVKDNASGDCEVFVLNDEKEWISCVGKEDPNNAGSYVRQEIEGTTGADGKPRLDVYIDSDLSKMKVNVKATSVSLDQDDFQLDLSGKVAADKVDLGKKLTVTPANTTDTISWSSSNEKVATVTSGGVITAVGKGEATITVKCGNFSDSVKVTVVKSPTAITFNQDAYAVDFGETVDLSKEYKVEPSDADFDASKLEWTVSDTDCASVSNGVVTGKSKGDVTVSLKYGSLVGTTKVKVTKLVKSITLDKNQVTVWKGESDEIKVTTSPEGSEWASITLNSEGSGDFYSYTTTPTGIKITGVKRDGTKDGVSKASILVDNGRTNELRKEITITVKENPITSAVITTQAGKEVLKGQTIKLEGKYTTEVPETEHKTTDTVTTSWTSKNPEIATVDSNGVVTGVKEGTATIEYNVSGKTATYTVKVNEKHVEGIVLDTKTLDELANLDEKDILTGDVISIPFTVNPEDTTDSADEIVKAVKAIYDKDAVDVSVEYSNGEGKVSITPKTAGKTVSVIYGGEISDEDKEAAEKVRSFLESGEYTDEDGKVIKYDELTDEEKAKLNDVISKLAKDGIYFIKLEATEPVPEQETENSVDTSDIPVALISVVMLASVAGITVSKKILVK